MAELSFLTIIVSLAVCSLLVYAAFQYMKVRLSILEQSHKEQAMILQQYIEESSTDIHRLYQMTTTAISGQDNRPQFPKHESIILEYANENATRDENEKPVAYNQPHTIHLDTAAFFQNKRASNLIEISSDSEDTTETETETESDSDEYSSTSSSSGSSSSDAEETSDSGESDDDISASVIQRNNDTDENEHMDHHVNRDNDSDTPSSHHQVDNDVDTHVLQMKEEHAVISEIIEIVCDEAPEIKTVTIDLGLIQEPDVVKSSNDSVLSMMYKKAQQTPLPEDDDADTEPAPAPAPAPTPAPTPAHPVQVPFSAMSVPDLKLLLKEKCKNQPEKHAEIQKLKKAELIYALQQLQ